MADQTPVTISESVPASSIGGRGSSGASPVPHDFLQKRAAISLWDSDWSTGRYYWTVVPVENGRDVRPPQQACHARVSRPVPQDGVDPRFSTRRRHPYVIGLSPTGRLLRQRPGTASSTARRWWLDCVVGGSGVRVAWCHPDAANGLLGPQARTFHAGGLPVGVRAWWYRVRGIDDSLPGNREMRWSTPTAPVAKPTSRQRGLESVLRRLARAKEASAWSSC